MEEQLKLTIIYGFPFGFDILSDFIFYSSAFCLYYLCIFTLFEKTASCVVSSKLIYMYSKLKNNVILQRSWVFQYHHITE